jgi:peptidyl-prolyl cis-trans isomerase D
MLEKVREPWRTSRTKSILAYVLFGLICLTFVFVGITPDNTGLGGQGTAATVNNAVISYVDLQERVQAIEAQMGGALKGLPAAQRQMTTRRMRENALDELVNYELVYQSAASEGVLPTISATRDLIVNIPAFQEGGRFQRERYTQYLQYRNTTAGDFENRVKKDVVVGQLRDLFMTALQAPKALDVLSRELEETKVNLEFVKFDPKALGSASVDAAAVAGYLAKDENKAKVKSYYDTHKDEFSSQAEVRASHILIKGDTADSKKKAEGLKKDAETGDFSELAKKHSEDEGSKEKGGDLNYFSKGRMVPEFEQVAFSLPVGKVSDPVKTAFGYHIIKVVDRKEAKQQPLEAVQSTIAKKLLGEESGDKIVKQVEDSLAAKSEISGWLAQHKLKWDETGEFALSQSHVPKVEAGAQALEAALTLKSAGDVYPKALRSGPDVYVVRLKKLSRPKLDSEAAKGGSVSQLVSSGSEALALWAEELRKSARIRRNEAILNN